MATCIWLRDVLVMSSLILIFYYLCIPLQKEASLTTRVKFFFIKLIITDTLYVILGVLSRCHKNNPDQHTTLLYLVFRDFNTQSVILYVMLGVISMCQKNH